MATELVDRVAIATAIRLLDAAQGEDGWIFVPASDAEDETRCLWIEDAEVEGVRGWHVSAADTASVAGFDMTPLAPLEEAGDGEG
jgi:hypothetical protein